MFKFFKPKNKKKLEEINGYKEAIKMIKFFIATFDWERAKKSIEEVRDKEINGYNELTHKLSEEIEGENIKKVKREKDRQKKVYDAKIKELDKLKAKLEDKESKYKQKIEEERFKVRFKSLKQQINKLIRTGKINDASNLLSSFLEENKDKKIVINFYNYEKRLINKAKEKQKKIEAEKLKQNAKLEALKLIGVNAKVGAEQEELKEKPKTFVDLMKSKLNFYKRIKEGLKKKKLMDEISLLIEEDSKIKNDIASQKLANIHKGLIKEISQDNVIGYDFFGKILGADKISGDTFGFNEEREKYNFFIGDATGHGIRAGFIVTLLSRLFNQFVHKKGLTDLVFEINNGLKQDLKSRNFITGVFFEIDKEKIGTINYVGMGHEPMYIYRAEEKKVEKHIPGGLAAGIRLIKDAATIKTKEIELKNGDVLLTYSDGVVEAKSPEGEFYGLERLEKLFLNYAKAGDIKGVYDAIINDVKTFKGGSNFNDDVTVLVLKRDIEKDVMDEKSEFIQKLKSEGKISRNDIKKIRGKTKDEIKAELEKIAYEKKLKSILKTLEGLYYTGETIKLKQEAIRFIKEGFIHKKINFYLKEAIANEEKYKIKQKEDRISNKYNVLKELVKKEDFYTVIRECEDIIGKDGNI